MPAQKKDPSVRARRNRAATASTLTTPTEPAPDLPAGRDWQPETREWWADVWASPMASEFHASDRHGLYILAALVDQFWTVPTKELASEIRLQRQAFGLTPYDRRRLEWSIETTEEAKDRGRRRRESAPVPGGAAVDPRSVLRAVN